VFEPASDAFDRMLLCIKPINSQSLKILETGL